MMAGRLLGRERQDVERLVDLLAANLVSHQATFRRQRGERRAGLNVVSIVISLLLHGLLVGRVPLERAGQGKLAELVADHVVVDVHRDVLLAVVHGDRQHR